MLWPDGESEFAAGFNTRHQSEQEFFTFYVSSVLCKSKESRSDGAGGVDDCLEMSVIIVMDM